MLSTVSVDVVKLMKTHHQAKKRGGGKIHIHHKQSERHPSTLSGGLDIFLIDGGLYCDTALRNARV